MATSDEELSDDYAITARVRLHDGEEVYPQQIAHGLQKGMVLILPDLDESTDTEMVLEIDATMYQSPSQLADILRMVADTLDTHQESP